MMPIFENVEVTFPFVKVVQLWELAHVHIHAHPDNKIQYRRRERWRQRD